MVDCVLAVEVNRLFTFAGRLIPPLKSEKDAALEVARFGRWRQGTQQGESLVGFAILQSSLRRGERILWSLRHRCCQGCQKQAHLESFSHRSLLIATPSCRGCPVVVPVATQSPSFSPESITTWVRLSVPITTGVRFNSSFTIL